MLLKFQIDIMLLTILWVSLGRKCSHDDNEPELTLAQTKRYAGRMDTVGNMRINLTYVDWGYSSTSSYGRALKASNDQAVVLFQNMLSVEQQQIKTDLTTCSGITVPTLMRGVWFNWDLIIFVSSTLGLYQGDSAACQLRSTSPNRVTFARLYWSNLTNAIYIPTSQTGFQSNIRFIMHELTHLSGFSSNLYNYWANTTTASTTINGTTYIISPNVRAQVNSYYHCSSLGMPLQTSAPSHWLKDTLLDELMVGEPYVENNQFLSGMTVALIQDTNWFSNVNTSYAQTNRMSFGSGRGCSFLTPPTNCSIRPEFCGPLDSGVTFYSASYGISYPDLFSSCSIIWGLTGMCRNTAYTGPFFSLSSTLETPGWNSLAYQSNIHSLGFTALGGNRCMASFCINNGTSIKVLIGGINYTCSSNSQVISNSSAFTGSLTCPANITRICKSINTCPNACNSSKLCINGQCQA